MPKPPGLLNTQGNFSGRTEGRVFASSPGPFLAAVTARPKAPVIRLTPLIDVVFILLVFFMLAPRYTETTSISLKAPGHESKQEAEQQNQSPLNISANATPMIIQIKGDEILLNKQPMSIHALIESLRESETSITAPIQIQPLHPTRVQQLITLLDQLNASGIQPLQLKPAHDLKDETVPAVSDQEAARALP